MNTNIATLAVARARKISKHAVLASIGAATLSLFALNASAALDVPQQQVDFKDLDLSKEADAKRLYRRLKLAASEVCVGFPDKRGSLRHSLRAQCEHNAVTNAVAAIAHPTLTSLHESHPETRLAQRRMKPATAG